MLLQLVSVGGIALIVALVWLVFREGSPPLDRREAIARADHDLPGFSGEEALCGMSGGALVADAGGRMALLKPHGDHLSVRLAGPGAAVVRQGTVLIVRTPERMFGTLRIDAGDRAGEWEAKLRKAIDGAA